MKAIQYYGPQDIRYEEVMVKPPKDGEVVELVIDDYIGRYDKMTAEQYAAALVPVAIATVETVKDVKKMSIQFSEELKAIAKGSNDMQS